jgi:hypothetical protein
MGAIFSFRSSNIRDPFLASQPYGAGNGLAKQAASARAFFFPFYAIRIGYNDVRSAGIFELDPA